MLLRNLHEVENIVLEASIKAAIASHKWVGRADSDAADQAAVLAMRETLQNQSIFVGKVVIGEGERDEAPMLYIGEELGLGEQKFDIAVDPLEGTSLCAYNKPNSLTTIAISEAGGMLNAPDVYMEKIVTSALASDFIDLDYTVRENLDALSRVLNKDISEISVVVLDRERHKDIMKDVVSVGAKLKLIQDGDINAAISVAMGNDDIYVGIGGAPEGVLAAAALKTIGAHMQTRLILDTKEKQERASKMGIVEFGRKYFVDDMVTKNCILCMTGVTAGDLCGEVEFYDGAVETSSIIFNSFSKRTKEVSIIQEF